MILEQIRPVANSLIKICHIVISTQNLRGVANTGGCIVRHDIPGYAVTECTVSLRYTIQEEGRGNDRTYK